MGDKEIFERIEELKKEIAVLESQLSDDGVNKLFGIKKAVIFRHIQNWVKRETTPTEKQKLKKQAVLKPIFDDITEFVNQNMENPDAVIHSEYSVKFWDVKKLKSETNEEFAEREAKSSGTYNLVYEDVIERYFS